MSEEWRASDTITGVEELLNTLLLEIGAISFERQYEITRDGKNSYWLDFAWPDIRYAVEIDGHPIKIERDAYLRECGWNVIYITNKTIHTRKQAQLAAEFIRDTVEHWYEAMMEYKEKFGDRSIQDRHDSNHSFEERLKEAREDYRRIRNRLDLGSEEEGREKLRKFMETRAGYARLNPKARPGA